MTFIFSFTRVSGNTKTGPIPTTVTNSASCPKACPFDKNGCYAQYGPTAMHWRKLDKAAGVLSGASGGFSEAGKGVGSYYDENQLLGAILSLPKGQLWRHNVAGDLPHQNETIDAGFVANLTQANYGKKGFTYTHHNVETNKQNRETIRKANARGFTINLSANNPEHADLLVSLKVGPVVTVLPVDAWTKGKPGDSKVMQTHAGNTIVICPAVTDESMNCARCGVCAITDRKSIIGFPAHGAGKNKATSITRKTIPICSV